MDRDIKDQVMLNRRPHSVDLGGLDRNRNPWLFVIPGKRNRPKQLDELPDEFRRAGIGVCFEGSPNMHALYHFMIKRKYVGHLIQQSLQNVSQYKRILT